MLVPTVARRYGVKACIDGLLRRTGYRLAVMLLAASMISPVPAGADAVLDEEQLASDFIALLAVPWSGDLPGMAERNVIRVATAFSRTHFFLDDGQPRGLTQELVSAFEQFLRARAGPLKDMRVVMLPMPREALLTAVIDGHADIAAANLTITAHRLEEVAFSAPWYEHIRELPVSGPGGPTLKALEDLAGQAIHVRRSSSYYESLQSLSEEFAARGLKPPRLIEADDLLETEDILELVAAGAFPLTVADDTLARLWQEVLPDLRVYEDLAIKSESSIGWAVRKESTHLLAAVNDFVRENKHGTLLGNILAKRYLGDNPWVRNALHEDETARLDALRIHFENYAHQYGFDWLLSAAQAYQESGLDHSVVSSAGAIGVMQLLPSTAADPSVNIPDIQAVENNIHAGIKYKRFMLDHYFDNERITPLDRFLFTLAAYNAGPSRINEYREKAQQRGLNPDRWFMHVEQVSNQQTRTYVGNIYKYYMIYREYQRRLAEVEEEKRSVLTH
jgi:membrane-bound lytic murein transglycosylase MltF